MPLKRFLWQQQLHILLPFLFTTTILAACAAVAAAAVAATVDTKLPLLQQNVIDRPHTLTVRFTPPVSVTQPPQWFTSVTAARTASNISNPLSPHNSTNTTVVLEADISSFLKWDLDACIKLQLQDTDEAVLGGILEWISNEILVYYPFLLVAVLYYLDEVSGFMIVTIFTWGNPSWIKVMAGLPRPLWVSTAIKPRECVVDSYGFPSGHIQNLGTLLLYILLRAYRLQSYCAKLEAPGYDDAQAAAAAAAAGSDKAVPAEQYLAAYNEYCPEAVPYTGKQRARALRNRVAKFYFLPHVILIFSIICAVMLLVLSYSRIYTGAHFLVDAYVPIVTTVFWTLFFEYVVFQRLLPYLSSLMDKYVAPLHTYARAAANVMFVVLLVILYAWPRIAADNFGSKRDIPQDWQDIIAIQCPDRDGGISPYDEASKRDIFLASGLWTGLLIGGMLFVRNPIISAARPPAHWPLLRRAAALTARLALMILPAGAFYLACLPLWNLAFFDFPPGSWKQGSVLYFISAITIVLLCTGPLMMHSLINRWKPHVNRAIGLRTLQDIKSDNESECDADSDSKAMQMSEQRTSNTIAAQESECVSAEPEAVVIVSIKNDAIVPVVFDELETPSGPRDGDRSEPSNPDKN
jgi:membrane-associated phospholipid phosphatase